jgi:hypothetical protein
VTVNIEIRYDNLIEEVKIDLRAEETKYACRILETKLQFQKRYGDEVKIPRCVRETSV